MLIQDEVKRLRSLPLFAEVDPARLKLLCFTSARESFEPGETLFHEGDPGFGAYVIMSGTVEVDKPGAEAPYTKAASERQVALVGQSSMLAEKPRSATVTAVTPVEALRINSECFFKIMSSCPRSSERIMRSLGSHLRDDGPEDRHAARPKGDPKHA